MKLFISDLDNTLIYSYRRGIGGEKVPVELKDGREISFMSKYSHELLDKINSMICFMPITTRSVEQYKRVNLNVRWTPRLALTANGGILLRGGEPDREWYGESLRLIAGAQNQLEISMKLLREDVNVDFEVGKVDGLFVFTKSANAPETLAVLKNKLDPEKVSVLNNGSKIYVLPKELNKGAAVERIRNRTGSGFVISAGDSEFDVPMLLNSDFAIYPSAISKDIGLGQKGVAIKEGELFSDRLLDTVLSHCGIT